MHLGDVLPVAKVRRVVKDQAVRVLHVDLDGEVPSVLHHVHHVVVPNARAPVADEAAIGLAEFPHAAVWVRSVQRHDLVLGAAHEEGLADWRLVDPMHAADVANMILPLLGADVVGPDAALRNHRAGPRMPWRAADPWADHYRRLQPPKFRVQFSLHGYLREVWHARQARLGQHEDCLIQRWWRHHIETRRLICKAVTHRTVPFRALVIREKRNELAVGALLLGDHGSPRDLHGVVCSCEAPEGPMLSLQQLPEFSVVRCIHQRHHILEGLAWEHMDIGDLVDFCGALRPWIVHNEYGSGAARDAELVLC
mmetsp:Transcript_1619/g.4815  ORF Transcript_1619/g.4815 Transcript_1619/m.4815 type:complete len:310 (-) Transcript_1619:880-1809(-)